MNRCKILGAFAIVLGSVGAYGQSYTEGFNDLKDGSGTSTLVPLEGRGWFDLNNSNPLGPTGWFGNGAVFPSHSGAGYIAANFNNTTGAGTISDWLITPTRTLNNGDTFSFWSRTNLDTFPDRLELRLSTNGSSTNVGATETSVGDFGTLLLSINPSLTTGVYPTAWTQFSTTLSGLSSSGVSGRLAFRYFVTSGGPDGSNSDYIGVDDVAYTVAPVPEPASMAVLGIGALALLRRRRSL